MVTKTYQFLPENRYDWATLNEYVINRIKQQVYEGENFDLHLPVAYYGNLFKGVALSYYPNGCIWLDLLQEKGLPDIKEIPLEEVPADLLETAREVFMDDIAFFRCSAADGRDFYLACDVDDWSDVFLPIGTPIQVVA